MIPTKKIQTATRLETLTEGIEHGCVSVEQQALLGRQSAAIKVGNEVGRKNSVSEVPRREKKQRTTGQRRRTESYGNATYKVSQRKRGYRKRMHGIWKQEGMK